MDTSVSNVHRFLIIDADTDGSFLLSRALLQRHPRAIVLRCGNGTAGLACAGAERIDVAIVHQVTDRTAAALIGQLKGVKSRPWILALRSDAALGPVLLAAGATRFHEVRDWEAVADLASEMAAGKAAGRAAA